MSLLGEVSGTFVDTSPVAKLPSPDLSSAWRDVKEHPSAIWQWIKSRANRSFFGLATLPVRASRKRLLHAMLAEDRSSSEPVSGWNSLLTGNNRGKFHKICPPIP